MSRFIQLGGLYRRLSLFFLTFMAILCALAPGARIIPAFGQPKLQTSPEILGSDLTSAITYNTVARVFNVSVDQEYHSPGDKVRISACWEALAPIEIDYTVFVHLIGPDNTRVAERHTYPGLGRYPTTLWETGKAFCDNYDLQIEDWAPSHILYNVEIGLFDTETGERLAATNHLGHSAEPPIVGVVPVIDEAFTSVPVTTLSAEYDDKIKLTGVDVPQTSESGQEISVTLHWEALAKPEQQLITFVHLWQPSSDQPLAQDDSVPKGGWFPTEVWEKGLKIADTHQISIPATLQPGLYPLWAGIYRASDGTRLPAVGPSGPFANDLVPIGEIEIKE